MSLCASEFQKAICSLLGSWKNDLRFVKCCPLSIWRVLDCSSGQLGQITEIRK